MTTTNETMSAPASREADTPRPALPIQALLERSGVFVLPLVAVAIFLGIWQVLSAAGLTGTLPGPAQVVQDVQPLVVGFFDNGENDKGIFWQLAASLGRVAIGYSLAAVVGVSLGILMGSLRPFQLALDPIFQVLRTIPPLAWLPIALAALSQANPSAIFVIFITAIWPIIINTAVGVRSTPQDYRNVASVLNLSKATYFFQILLPSAASYIFTGLRIAVGLAWLAIVAAEMLTGGVGIGFFIWDSYNSSRMADIILAVLCVGLVGFALDRLVWYAGRLLVASE
ncbi:nitrate ABC transporter permease [Gloeobacter kilaueensis]|uniref:Nitrate ABC transporter inner membrane subunit n=1 Tax=Gloeobacter kilaueensis (strain ATCC BAA-2537 / CCAP 1431/1 / ULC 316 / JS1) TaxID=1183438 RepID=U5QN77_GLOK1|nr:nitrate ABC transporter permease [Gloeobacter kilaueensis]AGY60442.1 nitrate ABC transporter inner membrane subunit [Gloeobacter kilaueensis JS1]